MGSTARRKICDAIWGCDLVLVWYEGVALKVEGAFAAQLALPLRQFWTCPKTVLKSLSTHMYKVLTLGSPVVWSCQRGVKQKQEEANLNSSSHSGHSLGRHSSSCLARLQPPNWTKYMEILLSKKQVTWHWKFYLILLLFSDLTGEAVFRRTLYVCEFTEKSWKHRFDNVLLNFDQALKKWGKWEVSTSSSLVILSTASSVRIFVVSMTA